MQKLILLILICLPFLSNAQKVEYDKKTQFVSVDGVNCFKMAQTSYTDPDFHTDIFDLEGNKVLRINYHGYTSLAGTKVTYEEFIFLDSKQKAELDGIGYLTKQIAKFIANNHFFVNGKLDTKRVDEFVLVHGTPFKDRAKQ